MRRLLYLLAISVIASVFFVSCSAIEHKHDEAYDYDDGYALGYEHGYSDGYCEGEEEAESYIYSKLEDLDYKCTLHPDEAIEILNNYIQGRNVAKEDLEDAVLTFHQYWWGVREIIFDN